MKGSFVQTLALLAAFLTVSLTAPAYAETSVGVVNIKQILKESKVANSVRSQLQAKQKTYQVELDNLEKKLMAENDVLVKERAKTEETAFKEKIENFRAKAASAQRDAMNKKATLDKAFASSLKQIQESVVTIVKQVATEKKLTMVVSSSQVIYADDSLDITQEVLKRLDEKLPNLPVQF